MIQFCSWYRQCYVYINCSINLGLEEHDCYFCCFKLYWSWIFLWVCGLCIFVTFTINLSILPGRCSPCFSRSHISAVERSTYKRIASLVFQASSAASNTNRSSLNYFPMFSQIEEVKAPCQGSRLFVMLFMVTSELF